MCSAVILKKNVEVSVLSVWLKRSAFSVENVWLLCIPVVPIIRKCKKSSSLKGATLKCMISKPIKKNFAIKCHLLFAISKSGNVKHY